MTAIQPGKAKARKAAGGKTAHRAEKGPDVAEVTLLPFAVPPLMRGFEPYIAREARKLSGDDPVAFERAARAVAFAVYRRVMEYRARGDLATNRKSLAAQLGG